MRRSLSEMSAVMYRIYVDWFVSARPMTESEHMACNMYRMMLFKAKSIWLMSKGIIIVQTQKGIIPDPSTMYPVLRSMYELLFLFKCMFVSSRNDKERELLLNLWKIKGNHNLTQMSDEDLDEESINRKQTASTENEMFRSEIEGQMAELNLAPSITKHIDDIIDRNRPALKGFKFNHCEHGENITAFQSLPFSDGDMGKVLSGNSYIYSHYSAHSHPSYLGVKHFEEMYPNEEEDKYVQEILVHACKYLDRFMKEFCEYKDSYRPFYEEKENRINKLLSRILHD